MDPYYLLLTACEKHNSCSVTTRVTHTAFADIYMPGVVYNSFTNALDSISLQFQ